MNRLFYRPKRLKKKTARLGGVHQVQRRMALFVCVCMILTFIPIAAFAADGYTVRFVNYDLGVLDGTGPFDNVPEGARLYTADELSAVEGFSAQDGCTWYLYREGGGQIEAFGPKAIPDPPVREGYTFRDWAAQGAADDTLYTVTGDTTFVARYVSNGQYVINLYYQFDNASNTVAAETSTVPYGWESQIFIQLPNLPSLEGLSPNIRGSSTLNAMISQDAFSGTLDEAFLQACRDAGYVAWDSDNNDYQKDENGNVQINIPVTYALAGEVQFKVEYYLQNAEDDEYTLVSEDTRIDAVTGTTHVSLNEMGLVKSYQGFTLTAASMEDADSYNVSTNGDSVIALRYDRNVHYVYYQMNGGNVRDPVELRYGQPFPANLTAEPTRQGYTFGSWTWLDADGAELSETPATMPDHDLTLSANWVGANTKVTLVYWLENANDDSFTVAGQREITVPSGQTVGYQVNGGEAVDVPINPYLTPEEMKQAKISDGEYFTFTWADSATQEIAGQYGALKTAEGDGSTVINIGYARNVYTLEFHLGTSGFLGFNIARGDYSNSTDPNDWEAGYDWSWVTLFSSPTLNIGGEEYTLYTNNYRITEKYGAFISDQWPVQDYLTEGGIIGQYIFYGWGAHHESLYAKDHPGTESVINGIYSTLSADLIVDPSNPGQVHHLVAYFQTSSHLQQLTYHHMFEAVPETGMTGTAFSGSMYDGYAPLDNVPAGGKAQVQGLSFYEYGDPMTVTSDVGASAQNHSQFANVTYRYGCYNGNDVYFFYTYDDYTVTYYENNANLADGTPAQEKTEDFHYVAGMNLAEQLEGKGFDYDYTPEPPYVSSYNNRYTFGGWYTDANLTFPVDWTTENPVSNVSFYAKWIPPDFTLTLIVPDGQLHQDSLDQFAEKGYTVTASTDGDGVTTYVVSGIPGGTKANEIIAQRHGAISDYGLTFDYWSYQVNGKEQHYLFDESQSITSDLTLTAQWKTEYTGQYVVRYLTEEDPGSGLEPVTLDDGTTYYRLREDTLVTNVAVGSSVTVEAAPIDGYLSNMGQITQTVEAPEGGEIRTYFNFVYTQISGNITYYVHYVLDTGADYGRNEPPGDVVRLADDKTVTVTAASLRDSTTISETAEVVGGYSPRDGWNISFTLSAAVDQNHLYIYYVSNIHNIPFAVRYFFQQADGTYSAEDFFQLSGEEALGKVLYSADLAENYGRYLENTQALDALMVGHVLDTAITESYLILTESGENVLRIYMKNGDYTLTYDLNDGGDQIFPASWTNADSFLTGTGTVYSQTVTYPAPADVPTTVPTRLSYLFTGWEDSGGNIYTTDQLKDAPWYTGGGLYENVVLYAQWGKQLTVTFDLRGGTWTDTSGQFHQLDGTYRAYTAAGVAITQPTAPTFTASDGTAYSFIGWTATDPNGSGLIGENGRVDLVEFERYRFDFEAGVTEDTTLYAVWDPDVTTFEILKTDTGDRALAGAEFTLERLQATAAGNPQDGYTYTPVKDDAGNYLTDGTFPARSFTTGENGTGTFSYLPAGYYQLTETQAPAGYMGLDEPVILFAPYGNAPPYIVSPTATSAVTGTAVDTTLTVQVRNVSQYNVTIDAPTSLTITYTPPDLIWNPETLKYEGIAGAEGGWTVAAPEEQDPGITVTNESPGASVQVEVSLQYDEGYQILLPLSTLTAESQDAFVYEAETGVLTGVLTAAASARFQLTMEGSLPLDAILPNQETQAGTITVRVAKTND